MHIFVTVLVYCIEYNILFNDIYTTKCTQYTGLVLCLRHIDAPECTNFIFKIEFRVLNNEAVQLQAARRASQNTFRVFFAFIVRAVCTALKPLEPQTTHKHKPQAINKKKKKQPTTKSFILSKKSSHRHRYTIQFYNFQYNLRNSFILLSSLFLHTDNNFATLYEAQRNHKVAKEAYGQEIQLTHCQLIITYLY